LWRRNENAKRERREAGRNKGKEGFYFSKKKKNVVV